MKSRRHSVLHFVVCIDNESYPASLEIGKLYRVIPDDKATAHGYVRVIDESGQDYAYSTERFFPLELPQVVEQALAMSYLGREP